MSEEFEGTAKESKLMHWIEHTLAPKTRAFMARPWLSGFTNGIMKCLPFILTGCLIFFYNAIRSWIPALPDLSLVQTYTFSMLGLIYTYMIPHELMATLKHRKFMVTAGITGICVYMLTMAGVMDETGTYITIEFARFGPTGSMVAMLVGLEVAFIFNLWAKVQLFKKGSSVPTFVQEWINNIIPIFVCVLVQMLIVGIAQVDLYSTVLWLFSPIQAVAQSFPGFVLWNFIQTFFYTIGVSGWTWTGLCNSWQVPAMAENIALGLTGVYGYLNVSEVISGIGLINLGGIGATLALNVLLLFSKSKRLRTLGRVTIAPSLFNINEPVLYGTPVVYNPTLFIPANITAIVGSIITWFIFRLDLLALPTVAATNVGTLPVIANTVMLTGDLRGILWWVVLFAVYLIIYFPFFKAFEKGEVAKENGEAAKLEAQE